MNRTSAIKAFLTMTALVACGFCLLPLPNTSIEFASRYPMRGRTPDFFARSTNNPSARYSGTIKPSNAKTPAGHQQK